VPVADTRPLPLKAVDLSARIAMIGSLINGQNL
jgi:hypothetical protein